MPPFPDHSSGGGSPKWFKKISIMPSRVFCSSLQVSFDGCDVLNFEESNESGLCSVIASESLSVSVSGDKVLFDGDCFSSGGVSPSLQRRIKLIRRRFSLELFRRTRSSFVLRFFLGIFFMLIVGY